MWQFYESDILSGDPTSNPSNWIYTGDTFVTYDLGTSWEAVCLIDSSHLYGAARYWSGSAWSDWGTGLI